jgi:hydroxymethylglutaryl-CoA lyase
MKRAKAAWPRSVEIFEVSPRDGLQAESKILSVEERVRLVVKLAETGLKDIEVGSFVRADRIPQLQDTDKVIALVTEKLGSLRSKLRFWAFVPNLVGLEKAIESGVDGVGLFVATSDTFCRKNVNRTQKELLNEVEPLLVKARKARLRTRVYLSTVIYCPYEKWMKPAASHKLSARLLDLGAQEISLGDTTGHGTPLSIRKVVEPLVAKYGAERFALHLHDTRGTALSNVLEGLSHGIRRFDASVGGTGGCPYAPGASGNLSTEDLLYMLQGMGWAKSVRLEKLAEAGRVASQLLGRALPSKVLQTMG